MAFTSYPFDLGAGAGITAAQWRAMARRWRGSGVNKGDQNGLVVAAGSGLQTTVASGSGYVRGEFANNDALVTIAHTAANATFGRLDLVVLRMDLTDINAPKVTAEVVTGTPSGSPALPGLTQTTTIWEIPLASVLIPALASSVSTITDYRSWAGGSPRLIDGAGGGTATTNSTTYTGMTTMNTGNFYSDGGDFKVTFCGTGWVNTAGGTITIGLSLNGGTTVFIGQLQSDSINQALPFSATHVFESNPPGFKSVAVQWFVGNAAHTASMNNSRRLIVEEWL
jgi:hypothetical protein